MRFPFFVPCLVWFPLAADPWMKTQARSEPGFMTLFTKISNGSKKIEVGIKSGERRANLPCLSGIIDHHIFLAARQRQRCILRGDCSVAVNQMKILASEPQVVRDSPTNAEQPCKLYLCSNTSNNMRGFPNKLIYPDNYEFWVQKIEHKDRLYVVECLNKFWLIDICWCILFVN